jgi:hypothetical protein
MEMKTTYNQRRPMLMLAGTLGLTLVLCLGVLKPIAWAARQYQTVPTMPPPSDTPTSTHLPTATSMLSTATSRPPTATSVQVTSIPPTQTAEKAASETAQLLPTETATIASPTSLPGATASLSGTATMTTEPGTVTQLTNTPVFMPTTTQVSSQGTNLGLYGVVGGGLVLVVLILAGVFWRIRRRTTRL